MGREEEKLIGVGRVGGKLIGEIRNEENTTRETNVVGD